jgi:hypothetical protein
MNRQILVRADAQLFLAAHSRRELRQVIDVSRVGRQGHFLNARLIRTRRLVEKHL